MTAANEKKISIRTVQVYRQPYYYGDILENITRNPFLDIVRETYKDTRSKLSWSFNFDLLSFEKY